MKDLKFNKLGFLSALLDTETFAQAACRAKREAERQLDFWIHEEPEQFPHSIPVTRERLRQMRLKCYRLWKENKKLREKYE